MLAEWEVKFISLLLLVKPLASGIAYYYKTLFLFDTGVSEAAY